MFGVTSLDMKPVNPASNNLFTYRTIYGNVVKTRVTSDENRRVVGSSPIAPTRGGVAQLVEAVKYFSRLVHISLKSTNM